VPVFALNSLRAFKTRFESSVGKKCAEQVNSSRSASGPSFAKNRVSPKPTVCVVLCSSSASESMFQCELQPSVQALHTQDSACMLPLVRVALRTAAPCAYLKEAGKLMIVIRSLFDDAQEQVELGRAEQLQVPLLGCYLFLSSAYCCSIACSSCNRHCGLITACSTHT
jgi:hypothetical protein